MYELQLHGIDLESALEPDPVVVLGDRYELQQVLLNLVTNAVQAVTACWTGAGAQDQARDHPPGRDAVLRVRDTGPGVPPHLVPHLFTPFFTTKESGPGHRAGPLAQLRPGEGARRAS